MGLNDLTLLEVQTLVCFLPESRVCCGCRALVLGLRCYDCWFAGTDSLQEYLSDRAQERCIEVAVGSAVAEVESDLILNTVTSPLTPAYRPKALTPPASPATTPFTTLP